MPTEFVNSTLTRMALARQSKRDWSVVSGRILEPPPKARGSGPRLCAEHQPQRHGEATRFGIIQRLCASALAAAGPSDTAAVRWWFQDAPPRLISTKSRLLCRRRHLLSFHVREGNGRQ